MLCKTSRLSGQNNHFVAENMFFPTYFILTALQQEEGTPRRREARRGAEAALRRRL